MELKELPNQIRKKSWQSQWTFLLPPICNRISVVFFTQHLRTSSSSSSPPWAQYHVIVFPLIYVFLGNLSTLRHCNIQREYQNLNRNPLPSPSPAPPALPRHKWPWDSSTRDQNPQQSSTDRQTESSKSKGPSRTVPRPLTDAQKKFSQTKYKRYPQNKNLLACCDFLLLRASFYYSPAMQLRPHRQQLLQHHATTTKKKKSPPLALPLRPFRTYGPALQKTRTETERKRRKLKSKNWKKENRRRYSY
jgi:hypothetical protein